MKTFVFVSIVFAALVSLADAATVKIAATRIAGTTRQVVYENCGWPASSIRAYTTGSFFPSFSTNWFLTPVSCSPILSPVGFTVICGWGFTFTTAACQYMVCSFPDIPGTWGFYVTTPTPNACNVDFDAAGFSYGSLSALCC